MPEIFRDTAWQFVGVVLAILAIIVSIILFLAQRKRKVLAYEVVSQTVVLSATEEVAGRLQILFEGEPVKKVHLLVIKLGNEGNIPITSSDYERQVSLKFTGSEKILSAEVSETSPSNLPAEIYLQEINIVLSPLLLNTGDYVVIKTLISGFSGKLEVDARIIGVKAVEDNTVPLSRIVVKLYGFLFASLSVLVLLIVIVLFLPTQPDDGGGKFAVVMALTPIFIYKLWTEIISPIIGSRNKSPRPQG